MSNARLFMIWLGRVLANALIGGLAFALVGAFCGGAAGFVVGLATEGANGGSVAGAMVGAFIGIACGAAGALIHLVGAILAAPGEFWEPFCALTARVMFGQMWGTVGACTAFIAFELVKSQFNSAAFALNANNDFNFIFFGAPISMIIGAIASAILKRE